MQIISIFSERALETCIAEELINCVVSSRVGISKPVINENTTRVVAAHQINVLLIWHVNLNCTSYYGM